MSKQGNKSSAGAKAAKAAARAEKAARAAESAVAAATHQKRSRRRPDVSGIAASQPGGNTVERQEKHAPKEGPTGGRVVLQEFKEQLPFNLTGSATFTVRPISLNPGDPTLFTRLAAVVKLYTYYRWVSLRLKFIPEGSAFATDNQKGEVGIMFQAEWYGSQPNSMPVFRARLPSTVGDAWKPLSLQVPSKLLRTWRYTRDTLGTSGADARVSDLVAIWGANATPNTNAIGYMMVEGVVALSQEYVPVTDAVTATWQNRMLVANTTTAQTVTSGVAVGLALTGATLSANTFGFGAQILGYGPLNLQLYPGTYRLEATVEVTATTITSLALWFPTVAGTSMFTSQVAQRSGSTYSTAADSITAISYIIVPETAVGGIQGIGPTVQVTGTGTVSVVTSAVIVTQLG